jgi:hypothetical protein
MHSRSINNYLSKEEIELLTTFISLSMKRFENYNGRIRMTPKRFNTDELQELYIEKYNEWEKAVKTQTPDSSRTHLILLRESDVANPCAIEKFLKALMQLIHQSIPPSKHRNILQKLEVDLMECNFSCPCPAEP